MNLLPGTHKLLWALLVCLGYLGVASPAWAAKPAKDAKPGKERLVLMPLRVGAENQNMQGAMETALVQGLQQKYEVFAGDDVAQKSREIFKKESRTAKQDCDETRCMEDIAIAFQSELIATANVTQIEGGYLLALSIRNVMDNKAVFSNSLPCRGCDAFQVVDRLKVLSDAPVAGGASQNSQPPGDAAGGEAAEQERQVWQAAEAAGDEDSYRNYLRDYPQGSYVGLAQARIQKMQAASTVSDDEKRLWQAAQDRHSVSAVQAYLDKYPHGRYTDAANKRLKKLRDEEAAAQQQPRQQDAPVSAAERLQEAEAASRENDKKSSSPLRVLPQYLEKVIPKLIEH